MSTPNAITDHTRKQYCAFFDFKTDEPEMVVSSLKGMINVKIPCEESNLETALVRSLKDRLSVNRALFLALFSDLKLSNGECMF